MGRRSYETIYSFRYGSEGESIVEPLSTEVEKGAFALALSPDQTLLYATNDTRLMRLIG
jgi:hypothetical protein